MKNTNLVLGLFIVTGLSAVAKAERWQKIVSCENGAIHLDVNQDQRQNLQMVIKGEALLVPLYRAGMISLQYGQQEYLLRGDHAELRQTTPTETHPVSIGGVFNPHNFRKIFWQDWNGNAIEVELRGSELFFKRLQYSAGTSCSNENGCYDGGGTSHRTYHFIKEYVLRGCRIL